MKKLIPAICMLLLSVALLATSTYAWFSMNQTVTVSGMQVTAKSDQIFIMVKSGHAANADEVQAAGLIADTAVSSSATLYPTAHKITVNSDGITQIEAVSSSAMANWYYKNSTDPALYGGAGHESAEISIASSEFGNYVLVNEFSISVADGSNAVSDLRVSSCTITTTGDSAVKVLVATSTGSEEFDASGSGSNILRSANLTSNDVEYVKVYIYWDGTDEDIYTNNIENLLNTSVEVVFTGDLVPAA